MERCSKTTRFVTAPFLVRKVSPLPACNDSKPQSRAHRQVSAMPLKTCCKSCADSGRPRLLRTWAVVGFRRCSRNARLEPQPLAIRASDRAKRGAMKLSTQLVVAFAFGVVGCGGAPAQGSQVPAQQSAEPAPGSAAEAARPALSAQECEASGGSVVGDIGDGAIHRPEYRCANGGKPSGSIRAAEGGPIAIEGSVCCPR